MKEHHGMSRSPEYKSWQGMIDRCHNPNGQRFVSYGGRGIKVCGLWRESFSAFLADVGTRPTPKHSIDRIDNDGDYEPSNCRWALREEQLRNTRRNIFMEHDGRRMVLTDWASETGINFYTLRSRFLKGLPSGLVLAVNGLESNQ